MFATAKGSTTSLRLFQRLYDHNIAPAVSISTAGDKKSRLLLEFLPFIKFSCCDKIHFCHFEFSVGTWVQSRMRVWKQNIYYLTIHFSIIIAPRPCIHVWRDEFMSIRKGLELPVITRQCSGHFMVARCGSCYQMSRKANYKS